MKKNYVKPMVISNDVERAAFPAILVAPLAGLVGYAATRAVVNASRATPVIKLNGLEREK